MWGGISINRQVYYQHARSFSAPESTSHSRIKSSASNDPTSEAEVDISTTAADRRVVSSLELANTFEIEYSIVHIPYQPISVADLQHISSAEQALTGIKHEDIHRFYSIKNTVEIVG
jgi:hypothetical protein